MLEWAWPWVGATAVLPLLMRYVLRPAAGSGKAVRVPFYHLAEPASSSARDWLSLIFGVLAWCALIAAGMRPQWVSEPVSLPATGRDLLVAVDISGSMETADLELAGNPATRLAVVKNVVGEFLEERQGDRVGLILFGRRAYLQTPLTFDRNTTRQMLDEAVIGLAGKETAIGDAIGLAVKRLREQPHDQKVLVLLTDGANTAGAVEPLKAAQLAAEEGVKVYSIGVGADEMLVRSLFGTRRVNPSAELDERTLTAIAQSTQGRYFRARDTEELREIYALLDELEPVEQEQDVVRPRADLFFYPLLAAILAAALTVVSRQLVWRAS